MKLIDILVSELPQRGGWPEGVEAVAQDSDGAVQNYRSTEYITIDAEYAAGKSRIAGSYSILPSEVVAASDRLTAIITRAQYESSLAASKGWIEWGGGECPVDEESLVDLKFNDGPELDIGEEAGAYDWHNRSEPKIIAYRLHNPDINSRAKDDRLEQDLNECIGQDVDMPEWSGDGLPPVGERIEYACKEEDLGHPAILKGSWYGGTIIAYHDGCVWTSDNGIRHLDNTRFRQIRTGAENSRYSAIESIFEILDAGTSTSQDAIDIFDAIAAGKIPGVKLEVK